MPSTILGLDIGGANLKAATVDKRAVSVPFALWKQPDKLPAALAELVGRFPDADELAVTMTGELCDCYETKREGVNAIIEAVNHSANGRRVWFWSSDGLFYTPDTAARLYQKVAAANWYALATYAGRLAPGDSKGQAVVIDIGSTTTDLIPIVFGVPISGGSNDKERLATGELVYVGVRRTPLCAVLGFDGATEVFATTLDVYLLLDKISENPEDRDTADNRPATRRFAHARIARMKCADRESMPMEAAVDLAQEAHDRIILRLAKSIRDIRNRCKRPTPLWDEFPFMFITSGSGEFLAREVAKSLPNEKYGLCSLNDELGPDVSACAPAFAVAVLAAERPG